MRRECSSTNPNFNQYAKPTGDIWKVSRHLTRFIHRLFSRMERISLKCPCKGETFSFSSSSSRKISFFFPLSHPSVFFYSFTSRDSLLRCFYKDNKCVIGKISKVQTNKDKVSFIQLPLFLTNETDVMEEKSILLNLYSKSGWRNKLSRYDYRLVNRFKRILLSFYNYPS